MAKSKNTEVEHIVKQKKRKNLPNTKVYGSIDGVVEMHDIEKYEIAGSTLEEKFKDLKNENAQLTQRINNTKKALLKISNHIENIERKLEEYGLE